jgi:hypothetical protein
MSKNQPTKFFCLITAGIIVVWPPNAMADLRVTCSTIEQYKVGMLVQGNTITGLPDGAIVEAYDVKTLVAKVFSGRVTPSPRPGAPRGGNMDCSK